MKPDRRGMRPALGFRRGRLVPEPVILGESDESWSWKLEPAPRDRSMLYATMLIIGGVILAVVTAPASG